MKTSTQLEGTSAARQAATVSVPRAEYERLRMFAESWLRFWQTDALTELVDREVAVRLRAVSHDLSVACHWSAATGPSHAELERLRYPWLHDPDWTPPMLAHRGGRYDGGPVDWQTGAPARPDELPEVA